jgi:hypothetical protein
LIEPTIAIVLEVFRPQMSDCVGAQLRLVPHEPFQPRFLGGARSFARALLGDLLDVALDDLAEWRSFRRGAVDEDAVVHLRFDIARPSFGVFARAHGFGDRRPARASNLRMPLLRSFLSNGRHDSSPNCAKTVPTDWRNRPG